MSSAPTFADKVVEFNKTLEFAELLPPGFEVMNLFKENSDALAVSTTFYKKFYDDRAERGVILGINPGRFGAGLTGVPFTDPLRLRDKCGISAPDLPRAREPSGEFIYMSCYTKWYPGKNFFTPIISITYT